MSPRAAWRLESLGFPPVYDYVAGKSDWMAAGLPIEGTNASVPRIGALADADVPTCRLDDTVEAIRARVDASTWNACIVVNEENVVLGVLRKSDLDGDQGRSAADAMRPGPSTYRPNVSTSEMLERMTKHDLQTAIVTTSDGRLVGMLRKSDLSK